jgi:glycogen synthase
MRVLIATDSFPPGCGGSGWSTYELARGLRSRGHEVTVAQPRPGQPSGTHEYDGFVVRDIGVFAPAVPYLRNYLKNERLYARLQPVFAALIRETRADVVHGQHAMTIPPIVEAGRETGVPSVGTIRDYWPVCYWSDLIHDPRAESLCPGCSTAAMRRCIRPRGGRWWPLALPLVPYMRSNLARKHRALCRADRIIGVSTTIAADLLARTPGLSPARVRTIPNPVDITVIREAAAANPQDIGRPYMLYVGKLAPNKGTMKLRAAIERADVEWPLVIVGDGPDRPQVEQWAAASGRDVRLTGWLPRERVLGWMGSASALVFPSHGPESLSRVLLESSVLGLPIAAMDTGGTRDIIVPGVTGLLSTSAEQLGADLRQLVQDRERAARLSAAARAHVETSFAADRVVARIERVYREVIGHA